MEKRVFKDEHGSWGVDESGVARCFEDEAQAARYLDLLPTNPTEADRDNAQARVLKPK